MNWNFIEVLEYYVHTEFSMILYAVVIATKRVEIVIYIDYWLFDIFLGIY